MAAAALRITIRGLESARRSLNALVTNSDQGVFNAILTSTFKIEADAKKIAPFDRGTLERSITGQITERSPRRIRGVVGAGPDYAVAMELGNFNHRGLKKANLKGKPTRFLFPAAQKNFDFIVKTVTKALKKAFRDSSRGRSV